MTSANSLQEALRHGSCVQHQITRRCIIQLEQVQYTMHDLWTKTLERTSIQQVVKEHLHQLQ